MKECTAALVNFSRNKSNPLVFALCYSITTTSGVTANITGYDANVTLGGVTYASPATSASTPIFSKGASRVAKGSEVQTLDIDIFHDSDSVLLGFFIPVLLRSNILDNARVIIKRAVLLPTGWDYVVEFAGYIDSNDVGGFHSVLHVKSDHVLLQKQFPRNVYSAMCRNSFCDVGCGLSAASYTSTAAVSTGTDRATIVTTLAAQSAGYWALGNVTRVSTGECRPVINSSGSTLVLMVPFSAKLSSGESIKVMRGCGRTQAACSAYGNLAHFSAEPYIPRAETAQ